MWAHRRRAAARIAVLAGFLGTLAFALPGCSAPLRDGSSTLSGDPPAFERASRAAAGLARGEEALALGEWSSARSAFAEAADAGADRFDAHYGVAQAELGAGRSERALGWLEGLARDYPERFIRAPALVADYCRALDRSLAAQLSRGALDAALRAFEARPRGADCLEQPRIRRAAVESFGRAAERAVRSGDSEGALAWLQRAKVSDPESPRPARAEARLLLDLGRVEDAIELLDVALTLHRGDPALQALMVEALAAAGEPRNGQSAR